jgi:hypothetical protein
MVTGGILPDIATYEVTKVVPQGTAVLGFLPVYPAFEGVANRSKLYFGQGTTGEAYFDAIAQLMAIHEKAFRAAGVTRDLKAVVGVPTDPVFARDVLKYESVFKLNQKSGADIGAANFQIVSLGPDTDPTSPVYAKGLAQINDMQPDIIASIGTRTSDVMFQYEKAHKGAARYVLTEPGVDFDFSLLFPTAADASRVLGILPSPLPTDPDYRAYQAYQKLKFPDEVESSSAFGMYTVGIAAAIAIAAVGNQPLTGLAIGEALHTKFKASSPLIHVQSGAYNDAFKALAQGQPINFAGVEFDSEGLQTLFRFDIFCPVPDKAKSPQYKAAGIYYDVATKTMQGTLVCP